MKDELRFHSERQLEKYLKTGNEPGEVLRRVRMYAHHLLLSEPLCLEADVGQFSQVPMRRWKIPM